MPRKTFSSNSGPNAEDRTMELFTNLMIDRLEQLKGDVKWEKPWFSKEGLAWPKNLSGREYSGFNAVALKMIAEKNKYELPVWVTFNRLTSMNYQKDPTKGPMPLRDSDGKEYPRVMVNKGEKSTPVALTTFTVVNKETKEKIPYDEYRQMQHEEQQNYNVYPKLQIYNVFNVCQTNLKEARPEVWQKLVEQNQMPERKNSEGMFSIPEVDAMVARQRFFCPIHHENKDACYYSISRDLVMMQPKETFKSGEAYVNNLSHECSHALGAVGRLDRFTPEKMGKPNFQANEELIAELSAALVSSRYGLEKSIKRDSIPYLKSWLDSLHESPSYIKNVMQDVKKTSSMLIGRLEEVKMELEAEKEQSQDKSESRSDEEQKTRQQKVETKTQQEVAAKARANESHESSLSDDRVQPRLGVAKAAPEPPKEEQEEEVRRGFHR